MKNFRKLEKRVGKLEDSIKALDWGHIRDRSSIMSFENRLLHKLACSVTGHTFGLECAFINKKEGNTRYGKFECINCHLEIERPLTDKEEIAAKSLGMLL